MDLSYPRDRRVGDGVPITIEVIADPKSFLRRAELRWRGTGETTELQSSKLDLAAPGNFVTTELNPTVPVATTDQKLFLHLVAFDDRGNEVLWVGDAEHPRELTLSYVEPTPWYERWWVWTAASVALAAGIGTTVYFATRSDPARVPFEVRPE
ncbi:hypothetical protein ACFL6C_07185 [Myxococcota bacterium]